MGSVASNQSVLRSDKERTRDHLIQHLSEPPLFTSMVIIGLPFNKFPRHQPRLPFIGRRFSRSSLQFALALLCNCSSSTTATGDADQRNRASDTDRIDLVRQQRNLCVELGSRSYPEVGCFYALKGLQAGQPFLTSSWLL